MATVTITDHCGTWLGCSIDLSEFLRETLGEPDADLAAVWTAWCDADDSRGWDSLGEFA